MDKKKISIIIPIYNTEKYLENLIDSINYKRYNYIEFIFIEDCSVDQSKEKIYKLTKNFKSDYKILENDVNRGLSYTRNKGIKESIGEYLYFLDSDDWLNYGSLDYIQSLIEIYKNIDIFIFDSKDVSEYIVQDVKYKEEKYFEGNKLNLLYYRHFSSCIKLYKKEIFEKIKFHEDLLYEDVFLTIDLFSLKELNILNTNTYIYNYRNNQNSIMKSSFSNEKFNDYLKLFKYAYENLETKYSDFIYLRLKRHILNQIKNNSNKNYYLFELKKIEEIYKIDFNNLLMNIYIDSNKPYNIQNVIKELNNNVDLYNFLDYQNKKIEKYENYIKSNNYWFKEKDIFIKIYIKIKKLFRR